MLLLIFVWSAFGFPSTFSSTIPTLWRTSHVCAVVVVVVVVVVVM